MNGNLGVSVRVHNVTLKDLALSRNKNVGTFHSAYEDPQCVCSVQNTTEKLRVTEIHSLFDLSHVYGQEHHELRDVIRSYSGASAKGNLDLVKCGAIKHRIDTGGAAPVFQRAYRIPYSQRGERDRQVGEMMENGIVEISKSCGTLRHYW